MKRALKLRLQKLGAHVDALPVSHAAARAAFERFRQTGDLPEDERLASLVVRRARLSTEPESWEDLDRTVGVVRMDQAPAAQRDDPRMDALYREAVWGTGLVRAAARHVLASLASVGLDVTGPRLAGNRRVPEYGSVGLEMLRFEDCLAAPPYEEQARRLFERLVRMRKLVPQNNPEWVKALEQALDRFRADGELPADPLLRDAVLADEELRHLVDRCVEEATPSR